MDSNKLITIIICLIVSSNSYGQSSLTVTFSMIWSDVKVKDNWTPSTAPNYKEHIEGSAFGYGGNLNYSFQPIFITKDKHILVNVSAGYFNQRFDIRRPFDYYSPLDLIFRTDYYIYHCWQASIGLSYNYTFRKKYFLLTNLSYCILQSFRQEYTPTNGFSTQVNHDQINFGRALPLSIGLNRYFGKQFSLGLSVVIPVYTRWRNDEIFRDDPSTFSRPDFSLGTSISIAYHFKEKR